MVGRVSCTPLGNGDEKGSANKSLKKHKRSSTALEKKKTDRKLKRKIGRQQKREKRKDNWSLAKPAVSYHMAQEGLCAPPLT